MAAPARTLFDAPAIDDATPRVSVGVYGRSNPGEHAVAFVARAGDRAATRSRVLGLLTTPAAWRTGLQWAREQTKRSVRVLYRVRDKALADGESVLWIPKAEGDADMEAAHAAAKAALEYAGSETKLPNERARFEFRDVDGKQQARCISAPRAPWESDRSPVAGHRQWSNEPAPEPGPWFDLPQHEERAPRFDPRTAGSSEVLVKYEEHGSYDIKIELPLCGNCGAVKARCPCHVGFTLVEGERFEDVTEARRSELRTRCERWDAEREAFWKQVRGA